MSHETTHTLLDAYVKLSDEDAEWLYPDKALEETAAHLLRLGADLAVITKGSPVTAHSSSPRRYEGGKGLPWGGPQVLLKFIFARWTRTASGGGRVLFV